MESYETNDNVSSQPLQHLLSLDWDDSNEMSLVAKSFDEEDKQLKPKKKVRFSDTVQQTYLDSHDLENSASGSEMEDDDSDQYDNDFTDYNDNEEDGDNEEEGDNDEEDSEEKEPSELELDKNLLESEDLPDDGLNNLGESFSSVQESSSPMQELCSPVKESFSTMKESSSAMKKSSSAMKESSSAVKESSSAVKESSSAVKESSSAVKESSSPVEELSSPVQVAVKNLEDLDIAVEKQLLQFNCQIQNEKSNIISVSPENKSELMISDTLEQHDSKNETNLTKALPVTKKNFKYDKRFLQKQSDKINELLKSTDLTPSNALQIRQAVWEAWSTVKKWEYITRMREKKKSSDKSDSTTESVPKKTVPIHQTQSMLKRANRKKKKTNLTNANKQNQLSNKQREMSKADKEESEMAFKSWKKQKEEILKQNAIKRQNEKLQKRMSSLLDEEMKKERAESAFIEWKMKKIHITKKEKEKEAWLMQKEEEAAELKLQRDKEAQEIFHKWLERKCFQSGDYSEIFNNKPPWVPPGHS